MIINDHARSGCSAERDEFEAMTLIAQHFSGSFTYGHNNEVI
jgi:hypothetical protein